LPKSRDSRKKRKGQNGRAGDERDWMGGEKGSKMKRWKGEGTRRE